MAGYISINEDNKFSTSTVYFDAIVNYSKKFLEDISPKLSAEIYEPIEEAGIFVLGLPEFKEGDFKVVLKALNLGYEECLSKGRCGDLDPSLIEEVMVLWKKILVAMEADKRNQ